MIATQRDARRSSSGHSPREPVGPPPSRRNVGSIGARVCPCAYLEDQPRHTSKPPSVTMNDGMPMYAMMKPWRAPMDRAEAEADGDARRSTPTAARARAERRRDLDDLDHGHRVADEAETDPTERSMLRDTMISTMPVAMIADRGGLDRQVPQVARREELPVGDDVEADPDDPRAATIPKQPGVDLGGTHGRAPATVASAGGGCRKPLRRHRRASDIVEPLTAADMKRAPCAADAAGAGRSIATGQLLPSRAGVDRAGLDALAQRLLVDPAGIDRRHRGCPG